LSFQGNFFPEVRHNILIEAIGRLEHCGHLRATGKGVQIKLYFGVAPQHLSSSPKETKA